MSKIKSNPCPICGDKHRILCRTVAPRRWNKYWMECRYCHYCAEPAATKWGARRKWNRAKNWRIVKRGVDFDS